MDSLSPGHKLQVWILQDLSKDSNYSAETPLLAAMAALEVQEFLFTSAGSWCHQLHKDATDAPGCAGTIWKFPSHGGTPSHHPLIQRIFPKKNHPAIGVPPCIGNPHMLNPLSPKLHQLTAPKSHSSSNFLCTRISCHNLPGKRWKRWKHWAHRSCG